MTLVTKTQQPLVYVTKIQKMVDIDQYVLLKESENFVTILP